MDIGDIIHIWEASEEVKRSGYELSLSDPKRENFAFFESFQLKFILALQTILYHNLVRKKRALIVRINDWHTRY